MTEKLLKEFDEQFSSLYDMDDVHISPDVKSFLLRAVEEAEQRGRDMAVDYIWDSAKVKITVTPNDPSEFTKSFLLEKFANERYRIVTKELSEEARSSRPIV
jgi:hypothetical protein